MEGQIMKKCLFVFITLSFLIAVMGGMAYSLASDITGTWVGTAEVPDAMEPDELTMVIQKKEGAYTGIINDSMGMLNDTECEDIKYEDGKLTLHFSIPQEYGDMIISCELKVEGDMMTGFWEDEEGSTGEIKMKKEK
jgi:hypothetical protein